EEARFNEQQQKIRKVDGELKSFLRVERTAIAEKQADQVARYALAAWKVQSQKPAASVAAMAKKESLQSSVLGRWVKFMERPVKLAELSASDEAQATMQATTVELAVKNALADRGKKTLDKAQTDLLNGLFGDKGVFTPTDDELKTLLPADKNQRLDLMKSDLAKLQKDD